MILVSDRTFWRWYWFFVTICSAWYLYISRNQPGFWFFLVIGSFLGALIILIYFNKFSLNQIHFQMPVIPENFLWLICGPFLSLPVFLPLLFPAQIVPHVSGKLLMLLWISGIFVWLFQHAKPKRLAGLNFLMIVLIGGVLFRLVMFVPDVQNAPFSLGWSEGSRYYNASLFAGSLIYGETFPWPVLHPTRYLLQAIPFWMGLNSILIHRLWQVFLWIGLVGLGSYSMVKKMRFSNQFIAWVFGLWLFLFFFQGAVYYHLMVCVIIVLLGYHQKHQWRTLLLVVIASVWAGLSRVNWMPVPAFLAVTLYLMETPGKGVHWLKYLKYPLLWCVAGGASALIANQVYAISSGNNVELFSSSLSSYMIWSRLLPNTTYQPGIILGLLIIVIPSFVLTLQQIIHTGWRRYYHWIRILGLLGILFVFGVGGVIVSVKIGGGGDLHNLDAFLVFWVLINSFIISGRYKFEDPQESTQRTFNYGLLVVTVLLPVMIAFQNNIRWVFVDIEQERGEVQLLQAGLDVIQSEPGDILFITERQLLTFGDIHGIELIADYEKVFLMEMVMSNNQPYLDEFHQKVKNHQYSAILIDPLSSYVLTKEDPFWVENNKWVDKVVLPIWEDYEPVLSFHKNEVNLLIPRNSLDLYDRLKKLKPNE